ALGTGAATAGLLPARDAPGAREAGRGAQRWARLRLPAHPLRLRRLLRDGPGQRAAGTAGAAAHLVGRAPRQPGLRRNRRAAAVADVPPGNGGMSWTLIRSIAREYVVLLLGILAALVVVFLVGDFVDRAKAYTGPDWISAVAELYLNNALVSLHQLAPASLLLAAGATISSLRQRAELAALLSLGFSCRVLLLPIGGLALLACVSLVIFEEKVVVNASRRVEEITVHRFNRWGDWRFYYVPKQWFRRGEHVFHLRGGDVEKGFENATILTMDHDFRLRRRIDAKHMRHAGSSRWTMQDVMERTFHADGSVTLRTPVAA